MMQNDPHGLILTLIAVSLVFLCLLVLSIVYSLFGKLNSTKKHPKNDEEAIAAAIAIALEQYSKKRIKNLKITIDDTLNSRWKNSTTSIFRQNP